MTGHDRLPVGARGLWRVVTEHGTTFLLWLDEEDPLWLRVPALDADGRPYSSGPADGRWLALRWGPYLTDWSTGRPEPGGDDDGWPVPGVRVGYGTLLGTSMSPDGHWYTTVVESIESIATEDLTHAQRRGLRQRELNRRRYGLTDRYTGEIIEWHAWPVGWATLVADLDERLSDLDPEYTITRVREEDGGLVLTASTTLTGPAEDALASLVREAEEHSRTTCQECSDPGRLCEEVDAADSCLATLCDACVEEYAQPTVPGLPPRRFQPVRQDRP